MLASLFLVVGCQQNIFILDDFYNDLGIHCSPWLPGGHEHVLPVPGHADGAARVEDEDLAHQLGVDALVLGDPHRVVRCCDVLPRTGHNNTAYPIIDKNTSRPPKPLSTQYPDFVKHKGQNTFSGQEQTQAKKLKTQNTRIIIV